MEISKEVRAVADELGREYVDYLGKMNGYEVYNPYNKPATYDGLPIFILKKGKEVRTTDGDEWLDIMDKFFS